MEFIFQFYIVHFFASYIESALYQKQGFKHKGKIKKASGKKDARMKKEKRVVF